MDSSAMFLCLCGHVAGRRLVWRLDQPSLSIGRLHRSAIHIPDPTVSKEHAEITRGPEGLVLRDLGSRNGTRLNGAPVTEPVRIAAGDVLTIGHLSFRVVSEGEGLDAPRAADRAAPPNASMVIPAREILQRAPAAGDPHRVVETLAAAGRLLVRPRTIGETCEAFLGVVQQAVSATRLVVLLRPEHGGSPTVAAARPASDAAPPVLSQAILDLVLEQGASVLAIDAGNDPRLRGRPSILLQAVQSVIAVPLLDGERVLGLLYADSTDPEVSYEQRHLETLTLLANMLAVKIRNARLLEAEEQSVRITQELAAARRIQRGILPARFPAIPGWDCTAYLDTCHEVGGDLYDFWVSPGGAVYVMVGDVSGKGISAALLMASVMASARTLYEDEPEPEELARRLNRTLHRSTEASYFVTAWIGRLDPASGWLSYVNAGHPRPLLVGEEARELPGAAPPLGVTEQARYVNQTTRLGAGAALLVYTDGITEAENGREFYGPERLERRLRDVAGQGSEGVARSILDDLSGFLAGADLRDDATLVLLRRAAAAEGRPAGARAQEATA